MRGLPILAVVLFAVTAVPRAAQLTLTPLEIEEAVRIGQTRIAADRDRFQAPYRILVNQPPVDFIDVVTPFRRVVIAADERARLGERSFGARQAAALLEAAQGRFDFVVELTFHPLNTFVTMPEYGVRLTKRDGTQVAPMVDRRPRFGARLDGLPPSLPTIGGLVATRQSQPMLGGTLTVQADGAFLDHVPEIVLTVTDGQTALATTPINLGALR